MPSRFLEKGLCGFCGKHLKAAIPAQGGLSCTLLFGTRGEIWQEHFDASQPHNEQLLTKAEKSDGDKRATNQEKTLQYIRQEFVAVVVCEVRVRCEEPLIFQDRKTGNSDTGDKNLHGYPAARNLFFYISPTFSFFSLKDL